MIRAVLLALAGLAVMAAALPNSFTITPLPEFNAPAHRPAAKPALPKSSPGFTAAPTPDPEASVPATEASKDASVSPSLFTRHDQYRGEGISPSSSAQAEQNRRATPGAGLNLTMPLQ